MSRKFTMSDDGELRCNILIAVRLTEAELSEYNEMAKAFGFKDFKDFAVANSYMIKDALTIETQTINEANELRVKDVNYE